MHKIFVNGDYLIFPVMLLFCWYRSGMTCQHLHAVESSTCLDANSSIFFVLFRNQILQACFRWNICCIEGLGSIYFYQQVKYEGLTVYLFSEKRWISIMFLLHVEVATTEVPRTLSWVSTLIKGSVGFVCNMCLLTSP